MRFRWIGVLAALLMLAPAAGFARTSTPAQQDQQTQPEKKTKKKSKKEKKEKKEKKMKSKPAPNPGL